MPIIKEEGHLKMKRFGYRQNQLKKNLLVVMYALFALLVMGFTSSSCTHQPLTVQFSPYVDVGINTHWNPPYQDKEPMDLIAISQLTGIHHYHLAFIIDAGSCIPAWDGQSNYAVSKGWGSRLTDKMRANSINYTISFGGAYGSDISKLCSESQLISTFEQILKTYQPQGLDFDIENGSENIAKLINALKQIQHAHPDLQISFTLLTLPEGLSDSGQAVVNQARANNLHYSINIMAMDYGPTYVNDMGQYAIQAATHLFFYLKKLYPTMSDSALWQMMEVTPMIGVNDVNVEQFTLTNVDNLLHFARQNKLRSLSMWSIARDNPCSDKKASPTCSGNNLQSIPYEFSRRFMQ